MPFVSSTQSFSILIPALFLPTWMLIPFSSSVIVALFCVTSLPAVVVIVTPFLLTTIEGFSFQAMLVFESFWSSAGSRIAMITPSSSVPFASLSAFVSFER